MFLTTKKTKYAFSSFQDIKTFLKCTEDFLEEYLCMYAHMNDFVLQKICNGIIIETRQIIVEQNKTYGCHSNTNTKQIQWNDMAKKNVIVIISTGVLT